MRKHFFALGFLSLFLAACSGSDDGITYEEAELVGKWYQTSNNTIGCEKDYIEFTGGHVFRGVHMIVSPDGGCIGTDAIGNNYGQSWGLKGRKITITYAPLGGTGTMLIKELTADKLVLENSQNTISTYTAN